MKKARKEEIRELTRRRRAKLKEVKRTVTVDGRTFLKSFYGATKEDAEKAYQEFLNPPILVALSEYADRVPINSVPWWFFVKLYPLKAHLAPNTIDALQLAARHLLPELQDVMIWDLRAAELVQALDAIAAKKTLRNAGAKEKRVRQPDGSWATVAPAPIWRPLSSSLVNKCRRLGLELNQLGNEEMPAKVQRINPKRIPVREEKPKTVAVYSPPEMRALLEASRGSISFVPVLLYAFCGLRLNEGIGCRRRDVVAGVLEVTVQDDGEGNLTEKLKTPNARRDLPLPAGLLAEMAPYLFGAPEWRLAQGRPTARDARIEREKQIPPRDRSLTETGLTRSLRAKMRRAGLRPLNPHELRHSFNTWLDLHGCPRPVRLALMGQSRKEVEDRYSHASTEDKAHWLNLLWEASFAPIGTATPAQAKEIAPPTRRFATGAKNGRSKLTETNVAEIRRRLALGETPYKIAKDFPVDRNIVGKIRDGKIWKTA